MHHFEEMSVDELIDYKLGVKSKIRELQGHLNSVSAIYKQKVIEDNINRRIKAAGLEGVVVVPSTGSVKLEGK